METMTRQFLMSNTLHHFSWWPQRRVSFVPAFSLVGLRFWRLQHVFTRSKVIIHFKSFFLNHFHFSDVLLSPEEVRVVAGSSFRLERELNAYSGVLKEILIHEDFSRSSLEGNLAIGFVRISQIIAIYFESNFSAHWTDLRQCQNSSSRWHCLVVSNRREQMSNIWLVVDNASKPSNYKISRKRSHVIIFSSSEVPHTCYQARSPSSQGISAMWQPTRLRRRPCVLGRIS
jgi:hypothetical protein